MPRCKSAMAGCKLDLSDCKSVMAGCEGHMGRSEVGMLWLWAGTGLGAGFGGRGEGLRFGGGICYSVGGRGRAYS